MAYGRRRAARRVKAGRFAPHPGWRHRVPEGAVVLRDQAVALTRVAELVDVELWRVDRRAVALEVLRGLVCGMAWDTGLVAGVTRAHLAAAAGCSTRTVSRVVAWAVEVGLLVCVEAGATAEFLGTDTNRAPSYVLTAPPDFGVGDSLSVPPKPSQSSSTQELGNPPACGGWETSPRRNRGLDRSQDDEQGGSPSSWPVFDRATTAPDRARAVGTLLERAGLGGRVVRWRAVAMLGPWFEAGWSVMGLLHALDHHPDRPDASRGDAARAARDPLRVLGHRLAPWRGRLADLPATLAAVDGHARRSRAATGHDQWPAGGGHRPRAEAAAPAARARAREEFDRGLAERRDARGPAAAPTRRSPEGGRSVPGPARGRRA